MKLVVFGANGPTGRLLTAQALQEDHEVTAFTRHPDAFDLTHPRLTVAEGDARNAAAVAAAVAGHDVVLSTLGVPFTRRAVDVYSVGGQNIVEAMRANGIWRLACVTSSALEKNASTGSWLVDNVVQPLVVRTIGKTVYADMHRLETLLAATDLGWTVLRPSGLCETADVTDYLVGQRHLPHLYTSRVDLADALLRQATDDALVGCTAAIATPAVSTSFVHFLLAEGVRRNHDATPGGARWARHHPVRGCAPSR